MNTRDAVNLALDGHGEGCRVIVSEMNSIIATRFPELQICGESMRQGDSILDASRKIREAWHYLGSRVTCLEQTAPWALGSCFSTWKDDKFGMVEGLKIKLVNADGIVDPSPQRYLRLQIQRIEIAELQQLFIQPIEHHHAAFKQYLKDLLCNGVTLFDAAMLLSDGDENAAKESVVRWSKNRRFRATKTGQSKIRRRAETYDLLEVVRDIAIIEELGSSEKRWLLDRLDRKLSGQD